jgi:hypothetical protein
MQVVVVVVDEGKNKLFAVKERRTALASGMLEKVAKKGRPGIVLTVDNTEVIDPTSTATFDSFLKVNFKYPLFLCLTNI